MTPAIIISKIDKSFGNLRVLCEVDFNIEEGCFFGLLGPNGAGKSTLINIMAGLTFTNKGSIQVMGLDVHKNRYQTRRLLGIVPQELAYDPFFTAREMLRLQSGYFGYDKSNHQWIDELLEKLGLWDKADTNLHQLSGGMKRRVMIAQALVHHPKVVVLDEPTAGVDVELRKVLWEFIRALHKKGHTILLTTHYLEEAEALCEKIAILNKGRLIANDSTKALLGRYPYRFLHLRLAKNNHILPEGIQDKIVSYKDNNLIFRLHRTEDRIADILTSLHLSGIHFEDLRTQDPGLEEVFLALTGNHHDK